MAGSFEYAPEGHSGFLSENDRRTDKSSNRRVRGNVTREAENGESIIIRACSSERYVNLDLVVPVRAVQERPIEPFTYIYTYSRTCSRGWGASTHVRIVVQARAHELPCTH